MNRFVSLLVSLFIFTQSTAQEVTSAPAALATTASASANDKKKDNEAKDQKFIYNNNICLITKKEQEDAKEYIIPSRENDTAPMKLALTIVQLRLINNAKFPEINCSLRYFLEIYYDKNGRRWGGDYRDSSSSGLVSEYLKILEKLRTDIKYKVEFEKTILNSSELSHYYGVLGNNTNDYSLLEPNLARKLFSASILNRGQSRSSLTQEEWQLIFDLFYSKNVPLQKELNDFLKGALTKQYGYNPNTFMTVYLSNANDLAYNDLFKFVFENMPVNSPYNDSSNPTQVKAIFTSKFIPDSFKCTYARDTVSKNAPRFPKENLDELKALNVPCLNESLADASKFIYPSTGCPEILIDKNEDRPRLLSKMSGDFSRAWTDCRKKCSQGEKCVAVQDAVGSYSFFNSKYEKDLGLYKEMQTKFPSQQYATNSLLKYDYKPVAVCSATNTCGEKIASCADTDILKKINDELKAAKYQACKTDADCYVFQSGYNNCTEIPINVNLCPQMSQGMGGPPGMPQPKPGRCYQPGMPNFLSLRLQKISEQCGKPYNHFGCHHQAVNASTVARCEKNLCVVSK